MIKIKQIRLRNGWDAHYKQGHPLISAKSLEIKDINPGEILDFIDKDNEFVARGYYGEQNKGSGWILSLKEIDIDMNFFINKFAAALARRTALFQDEETTAFRIFNGEGDGVGGITIDYFNYYIVITWYNEGIYQYRTQILEAIQAVTYVQGIYEKRRFDNAGKYIEESSFTSGQRAEEPIIVKENNVNYAVYLDDGAMVGIFLDQKEVRNHLKEICKPGMKMLNMFSYTGAFSMPAALSGAVTTSVDLASRSLEKTIENFKLNDIDEKNQNIVVIDVFDYFDIARKNMDKFDVIVLDPPSYANSKKRRFTVQKDYGELIEKSLKLIENNGIIVASTNCSVLPMKKFKTQIDKAFENQNMSYELIKTYRLPIDFVAHEKCEESNYLKVLFMKVKENDGE